MKEVNLECLVDGLMFYVVTMKVTEDALVIHKSPSTVSKKSNMTPAAGCDFIGSGSSLSSSYFFENPENNLDKIFQNSQFGINNLGRISAFCYCLPENLDAVKAAMISKAQEEIGKWIESTEAKIGKFKGLI